MTHSACRHVSHTLTGMLGACDFSVLDTCLIPANVLQDTQDVLIDTNIQTKAGASVSQLLTSTQGQAGLVVRPSLALCQLQTL